MTLNPPHKTSTRLRPAWLACIPAVFSSLLAAQTPAPVPVAGASAANVPSTLPVYEQALQSLARGELAQAEQQLLQTIQTHPEWAGAWLDLALLALRQSQYAQAEELVLIIEEKFKPLPPGIQQALTALRHQLALHLQSPADAPQFKPSQPAASSYALALTTGYDSNANAGLHQNDITLTLPTGEAILAVDSASRAQGAAYTRLAWVHQSKHDLWGGGLIWQWQVQARQNWGMSAYDSFELVPQATLVQRRLPGDISLAWQAVWLHGQQVYQTPVLRWQHQTPWAGCELQNGLQAEQRQYSLMPHMNSKWLGYKVGLQCPQANTTRKIYLQKALEKAASTTRPGGDTQHLGWGLQQEWRNIGPQNQHNLQLKIDSLQSQDTTTYSSLLDNGQPRRLQRIDWQLLASAPVRNYPQWRWVVAMMQKRQKSNISIFKMKNNELEIGIIRDW